LDIRFSKIAKDAYEMRSKSDYGDYIFFSQEEIGKMLQEIKEFVSGVEGLLKL